MQREWKQNQMKKINQHAINALLAIALVICFSACKSGPRAGENEKLVNGIIVPELLARSGEMGPESERKAIENEYNQAVEQLKVDTADAKPYLHLASAFILEGRVTGNGVYYSNAAIKMLDHILQDGRGAVDDRFQAITLKSTVLLNLHQFQQALDVAKQGLAINDFNAGLYGALTDAHIELGQYDEAVKTCDKMLSLRPDLRSYSRASYIRQIFGDNAGAIDVMKMAVESGVPGDEATEWARVNLGDIYLNTGKIDSAYYEYQSALNVRPNYPHANMGLARAAAAEKKYDEAIAHARDAIKVLSEGAFIAYLADLHELKGDAQKAKEIRSDVKESIVEAEKEAEKQPVQHNGNRELAMAFLNTGDYKEALAYAQKDYQRRPENNDVNELMGWINYQMGNPAKAKEYAAKSLRTNTKNPISLYRAGLIYEGAGEVEKGNQLKQDAIAASPGIDSRITKMKN